jgi:hemolysin-activating ACP:hemolysin acyltransferase
MFNNILYIKSKEHLLHLLETNNELQPYFKSFIYAMDDLKYGCKCAYKTWTLIANEEYNKIVNNDNNISLLKEYFKSDNVIFM